jgi:hypothetical protein
MEPQASSPDVLTQQMEIETEPETPTPTPAPRRISTPIPTTPTIPTPTTTTQAQITPIFPTTNRELAPFRLFSWKVGAFTRTNVSETSTIGGGRTGRGSPGGTRIQGGPSSGDLGYSTTDVVERGLVGSTSQEGYTRPSIQHTNPPIPRKKRKATSSSYTTTSSTDSLSTTLRTD